MNNPLNRYCMKLSKTLLYIITFFIVSNCQTVIDHNESKLAIEEIPIPVGFTFESTKEERISLTTNADQVDVYTSNGIDTTFIGRYSTTDLNQITTSVESVEIIIKPLGVQLPEITSMAVQKSATTVPIVQERAISKISGNFYAIGVWDINGKPTYLEPSRDLIDQSFIDDINASLPETRPVPQYNANYLNGKNMNTEITELADVWVTFVHEGAGWKNALGYFTYPLGNTPTSTSQIDSLFVLFPNVSFSGSGGALLTGDKVYLGRFPANTGIGWFLIPNGFSTGNGSISITAGIKYSIHSLNDFTASTYNQHTILLNDAQRELLLLGFEDTSRPGGDNDFNDAIFFVSSNPYRAINNPELLPIQEAVDTDSDGVFDHEDSYPNDSERAFDAYFPSANQYNSFLAEDLWPVKGDYDFNDVVVDYRIHYVHDSKNQVKEVSFETVIKANGGYQQNSMMMRLPVSPTLVEKISDYQKFDSYIQLAENGTEKDQSETVFILTDNLSKTLPPPIGSKVTNVINSDPKMNPVNLTVKVTFTSPISKTLLGSAPYDPFVIPNLDRSREIHLAGKTLTDKANAKLLGTQDDASGSFDRPNFTSKTGLPWAFVISSSVPHSQEGIDFTLGFLKFSDWASSKGTLYSDWFLNKTNYRNTATLYLK